MPKSRWLGSPISHTKNYAIIAVGEWLTKKSYVTKNHFIKMPLHYCGTNVTHSESAGVGRTI